MTTFSLQKQTNMRVYFLLILFTQNNIFLTLINSKNNVFIQSSLGTLKIKGLKKLSNSSIKNFISHSLSVIRKSSSLKVHIRFKGLNKCKKNFIKFLLTFLIHQVLSVGDNSLKPNNGCKLKKNRRL